MRKSLLLAALSCTALTLATSLAFADAAPAPAEPGPDNTATSTITESDNFFQRFYKAYADEIGYGIGAPAPGSVDVSHRVAPWPPAPQSSPPFPFTEWPVGGENPIGTTTPNSVDSPLMTALAPTGVGRFLVDNGIQIYGWVNPGGNVSTSQGKGGNSPAAYSYDPNILWLDQVAVIIEKVPDTVQKDHIDWGFRVSPIFGETYRYTTSLGFASYQLLHKNQQAGWDSPMVYGELYIPNVMEGLLLRLGRYISVPDTEAQLAPNNYMYSHSMTYAFDNYTNTGLLGSLAVNRNVTVQLGITTGTDSAIWDAGPLKPQFRTVNGTQVANISNNDPGVQPSLTACFRYQTDTAYNTVYFCANGLNDGKWGYNNLQQYAMTFYHKFNEKWHMTYEVWDMHENDTPNSTNPLNPNKTPGNFGNLGNLVNGPNGAWCKTGAACTSQEYAMVTYLNYRYDTLNNLSLRAEFFNDMSGQRTGTKDRYLNWAVGWQHWFSPTIMIRPEVAFYNALDRKVFSNGTKQNQTVASMDLIYHF